MNLEEMLKRKLFTTNVGSHMWKAETPSSDVDLFICYVAPLKDILIGMKVKSKHHQVDNRDMTIHEIGHVVRQIGDNNVNFMWGVLSPITVQAKSNRVIGDPFNDLRELTRKNLSKKIYHSIHGLAVHNYKKYIKDNPKNLSEEKLTKKCNIVYRTAMFGCRILIGKGEVFLPSFRTTPKEVETVIAKLDRAYEQSNLSESPQHMEELYDWLCDLRLKEAKMEMSL